MKNQTYLLKNLNDTNKIAQIIAKIAKPNLILLLNGALGSGKTQITKLIGFALGINDVISSPTFIIWNQYQTKYNWKLIHIDAYRLIKHQVEEYYEIMNNNFTIIEWPEKLNINFKHYPYLEINFKITSINTRKITINSNMLSSEDEQYLSVALKKFN